jgi:hypothetical protein
MYRGEYEIEDFVKYNGETVVNDAVVLTWSATNGYQFRKVDTTDADIKIIAVRSSVIK